MRNRSKIEFNKKDEEEKMVKWQSKLVFNGIHKSYFGGESIQLHYGDGDSMVISAKAKGFLEDLNNLRDLFDFSN